MKVFSRRPELGSVKKDGGQSLICYKRHTFFSVVKFVLS